MNLGQLKLLERFNVGGNQLTRETGGSELGFLTSMINCSSLEYFIIRNNPFGGTLPNSVGNLSSSIQRFDASFCQIGGQIPVGIGSLNVNSLLLSNNNLQGTLPSTIGGMKSLQRLYLDNNEIEGLIPDEICILSNLGEIFMSNNKLSGSMPYCIGNLSNLQLFLLDSNMLNFSVPSSLWSLRNLLFLNLSSNLLGGSLNSVTRPLKLLESMDLSRNQISGEIPGSIGTFQSLRSLNRSWNSFLGPVPESLGSLMTLDYLDLSHNNLSGSIPRNFEALPQLIFLNLSFNKLSGEIPSEGPFKNLTMQSFMENEALCGPPNLQVPSCKNHIHRKAWNKKLLVGCSLPISALLLIFLSAFLWLKIFRHNNANHPDDLMDDFENRPFSYHDLCHATNNFCDANLLGAGSFGSVYKGILSNGTIVVVKVVNLETEGAPKTFEAECSVLRAVRHRNLVKVITTCSNPEFRALLLEYMSNGSLEKWLYSDKYSLNLYQRLSIMADVALALEYLHHGQLEPVVHCDLKPTNVLLDHEMVAHLGDFGIAKILTDNRTTTLTWTLGTLGYIAPESPDERGDMREVAAKLTKIRSQLMSTTRLV